MKFIWDPAKEKINIRKHKISFTDSCYIFTDQYSLNLVDKQHSEFPEFGIPAPEFRVYFNAR